MIGVPAIGVCVSWACAAWRTAKMPSVVGPNGVMEKLVPNGTSLSGPLMTSVAPSATALNAVPAALIAAASECVMTASGVSSTTLITPAVVGLVSVMAAVGAGPVVSDAANVDSPIGPLSSASTAGWPLTLSRRSTF